MAPSDDMFVTTDPAAAWKEATPEVTQRQEPAPDTPANKMYHPGRVEGQQIDYVSSSSEALARVQRSHQAVDDLTQSRSSQKEQRGIEHTPPAGSKAPDIADASTNMGPAAGTAQHMSHDELRNKLGSPAQTQDQAQVQVGRSSQDELRNQLRSAPPQTEQTAGRDVPSAQDQLRQLKDAPQTLSAEQAWERTVQNRGPSLDR